MTQLAISNDQKYWTPAQISALKQLGLSSASEGDLSFFFHQAQRTGLDPFARQIYMIERGGRYGIQTSIDGLRIIAQRSNQYAGQTAPYWCGSDGEWKDVWLSKTPPLAAKIGVYRAGFAEATWAVAKLESYCPMTKEGKPMGLWAKMPEVMLAKCAESLALRKAFPNDMSGLYTDEEMGQADIPAPEPKIKPQKVELQVVPNPEPEIPLDNEQWTDVLAQLMQCKTKDEVKIIWNKYSQYLDVVILNTETTLRERLLDKVAVLNA